MNASLVKLYLSIVIGAFFPLGAIIIPFLYYSLAKVSCTDEQAAEMQRHLRDIINFQIMLYIFIAIYMAAFWYLQISSYNEGLHFATEWLYVPVLLYAAFMLLYPLLIAISLKVGKRRKRYYYSLIKIF